MLIAIFLVFGLLILSIVLNILRVYHLRKKGRGYFLNHKTKDFKKFDEDLKKLLK